MQVRWKFTQEDLEKYKKERLNRPSAAQIRKYYGGFKLNMIRRKPMFDDELKDLALVYKSTLEKLDDELEDKLTPLLYYMKEFIQLHEQKEAIEEKLENLIAKVNPQGESNE